jgi:hypothetical protein
VIVSLSAANSITYPNAYPIDAASTQAAMVIANSGKDLYTLPLHETNRAVLFSVCKILCARFVTGKRRIGNPSHPGHYAHLRAEHCCWRTMVVAAERATDPTLHGPASARRRSTRRSCPCCRRATSATLW